MNILESNVDLSERKSNNSIINKFTEDNPRKISWTRKLEKKLAQGQRFSYNRKTITKSLYRSFFKQWVYYDQVFNEYVSQMPRVFPLTSSTFNRVIITDGKFSGDGMFVLMSDILPDLQCNRDAQCFPLFLYNGSSEETLESARTNRTDDEGRKYAITFFGFNYVTDGFLSKFISREDVFYYIYGILYSPDYLEKHKNNLSKQLPRIPKVKREEDFWAFSKAGRELGDLHCGYEDVTPYNVTFAKGDVALSAPEDPESFYRVEKMNFGKKGDKSTVVYNNNITITDIPLEAYDYVINRKPALEWVMDRQCVKTDTRSGIVNDANHYALETVGDPAYPLKLFQRVITVSLETMRIVRSLPNLDIDV